MPAAVATPSARPLPPVMGRLLSGTFWMALRTPLQAIFAFWNVPLILGAFGPDTFGAYGFAWGFGFFQSLLEFGMSSALQRQVSEAWTRGDRRGVERAVACGITFYAAAAVIQAAALLGIAYLGLPYTGFRGASARLIVRLLWLQALTAPCYGLTVVASSVLQAARRYDFIPRLELVGLVARFAVLLGGLAIGASFFSIVVAQTLAPVGLVLAPALWVMVRDLGCVPRFGGTRWADFAGLIRISFYLFLIQLSVVLATNSDKAVLGFTLPDPDRATAIYEVVSKPFLQIRYTGGMLAFLVMPAVASLAAARDQIGLERIKYDGPRLHIGLLLPLGLLIALFAEPFLGLWVGRTFGDQVPRLAGLLQLFLVAALPLVLAVHVQMAIGRGRVEVIALSSLMGAVVNLPLSYLLTRRFGDVSGVIWGTVLTTLVADLLIPGIYVARVLEIHGRTFLSRTLSAPLTGALCLLVATWIFDTIVPPNPAGPGVLARWLPLLANLSVGGLAYMAGYLAVPTGRGDLAALARKLRRSSDEV